MKNKTDIHSHILFGIDDGSRTIDESIELLKKMNSVGFTNVILTPHYIEGSDYSCPNIKKEEILKKLKSAIKKNKLKIDVFLGNEIFINDSIDELISSGEISSLNNGKYLLIELPFQNKINNLDNFLFEIKCKGYEIIIAHPERYEYFQNNPKLIDSLREIGILFQSNYASILGYYGRREKKLMKYLLKKGYVDYLGTDIHSINKTYIIDNFLKIEKNIIKVIGEDNYKKIIENCNDLVKS